MDVYVRKKGQMKKFTFFVILPAASSCLEWDSYEETVAVINPRQTNCLQSEQQVFAMSLEDNHPHRLVDCDQVLDSWDDWSSNRFQSFQ